MTAFVDTNVLIRHLTGDPPDQAARATAFLAGADELLLPDLIVAEVIYVLESFYEVPADEVAQLVRSVIAFPPIRTLDPALLLRSLEVYETHRIDFAEAYLVASAEASGIHEIISYDRSIDRVIRPPDRTLTGRPAPGRSPRLAFAAGQYRSARRADTGRFS